MKPLAMILGGAGLTAACGLSLTFALLARHQYGETMIAKVWPAGVSPVAVPPPAAPGARTVMLFGDSRMAEWGTPSIMGWRVVNAGFPGLTTAQLALRRRELLVETHPALVVIQAGINDLKLLGVRPEMRDVVTGGCLSNLLAIARECRQSGARVVVTAIWPAGPPTWTYRLIWNDTVASAVTETNARLARELANEPGVRFLDLLAPFANGAGHPPATWYRDTLHLTPEAYAELTPKLAQTITNWLERPVLSDTAKESR